jgi:hypothetical protein
MFVAVDGTLAGIVAVADPIKGSTGAIRNYTHKAQSCLRRQRETTTHRAGRRGDIRYRRGTCRCTARDKRN